MGNANRVFYPVDKAAQAHQLTLVVNEPVVVKPPKTVAVKIRQGLILVLLLLSLALWFYTHYPQQPEPVVVVEPIPATSILLDFYIDTGTKKINQEIAPADIVNFIGSNRIETINKNAEIVIYELIDTEQNQRLIELLLQEAGALLAADKLTSPEGKNALEKYAGVLALDSANEAANVGIQKIVDRYVFFIEKVINKREAHKVPGLLNNLVKLGPYHPGIRDILNRYKSFLDETAFINLSALTNAPVAESEPTTPPKQTIKKTLAEADREIAVAAARLISNDDNDSAITLLQQFVDQAGYYGVAHNLLLQTYLDIGDFAKAEQLVDKSAYLDIYNLAENVARIFIARGDREGAVRILNSHKPELSQYSHYYFLQAGLYHMLGDNQQAVAIYRRLLQTEPGNARYWLGMAVALDAQNSEAALQAFAYANQYAMPESRVNGYIDQRVLVLPD